MTKSDIPKVLLQNLEQLEPGGTFSGHGKIQSSSGKRYFSKTGSPGEAEQYLGEAESLRVMHRAAPGICPQVFACGVIDKDGNELPTNSRGTPYFLSEYKDFGALSGKATETLAKRLATEMHRYKNPEGKFGFGIATYCGATRQPNGWHDTWEECYSAMVGNLLDQLKARGRFQDLYAKGKAVQEQVIPALLGPLKVDPVILHGDLWSGNVGTEHSTGEPVIFDPSSFYGHNEADLAIARIFGGFGKSFFGAYHSYLPKTEPVEQYGLRCELYEMYHYLNHTVLFGGSYAGSTMSKMTTLLNAKASGKL